MTEVDLVLTDARIHFPEGEVVEGWIAVVGGRIDSAGEGTPPPARSVIDCGGRWIIPGLVDIHVHFRDPGFTHKEDFRTGSAAAAAGGVTTVVDMPNTGGAVVTPDDVADKLRTLAGRSYVDFGLYALLADSAAYLDDFKSIGVAGLKWMFGHDFPSEQMPRQPPNVAIRATLDAAGKAGMLVGIHAEHAGWLADLQSDLKAQGRTDAFAHGDSRPPFTEALAVAEAVILAGECGCRLHVHHLSSKQALDALSCVRNMAPALVTAEVCPHHLFLTQADLRRLGNRGKVNPPLRDEEDVLALWEGIRTGAIDCVASDHAPHTPEEKATESVWDAASGLIGVETIFSLLFHETRREALSMKKFLSLTAERPAELVGLGHRKGRLFPGYDADLVVVDPDRTGVISSRSLHSKHPDTPFEGMERQGTIISVYLRGRAVIDNGSIESAPMGLHVRSMYSAPEAA